MRFRITVVFDVTAKSPDSAVRKISKRLKGSNSVDVAVNRHMLGDRGYHGVPTEDLPDGVVVVADTVDTFTNQDHAELKACITAAVDRFMANKCVRKKIRRPDDGA
jgi:hypothetical protein